MSYWQQIGGIYQNNQDLINNLLSGTVPVVLPGTLGLIWWLRQQNRDRLLPPNRYPFEIISPRKSILAQLVGGEEKDSLADARIPYQNRLAGRDIQEELEGQLEAERWLLIIARTGVGKTREAAELAQLYSSNGWTILYPKLGEWLDVPTREQLGEIGTNRKLLFFLDDLNQRMYFGEDELSPRAEKSPLEPLNVPLQLRLLRALEAYEKFCGSGEIRIVATARNEKQPDYPGEPSAWEKLQWEKYPQLWQRFTVYELPEPEDEAVIKLLQATVNQSNISAKTEDYPQIARRNDCTFRNIVENLRNLKSRHLPLTIDNYRDTLKTTWHKRYEEAINKYPLAIYIYDAIDLLEQFNLPLQHFLVEPTALLMSKENSKLWQRYTFHRTLDYLIESERILTPRDGQIESKGNQVKAEDYLIGLTKVVLEVTEKHPQKMLTYLLNFGVKLSNLNYQEEALTTFEKATKITPQLFIAWYNRGIILRKLERYAEAIASYDQALKIKPEAYEVWNNRGIALRKLTKFSEAVASFDQALQLEPLLHKAWYNRGIALRGLGKIEAAIASYNKALAIKPQLAEAWYNRGILLKKLGKLEAGIASYNRALKLQPNNAAILYNRAGIYALLNKIEPALKDLQQALKLNCDKYQTMAENDRNLDNLRTNVEFQNLVVKQGEN
ncbi:MAG: tetratricopeptide repeat protein [Spirulinaceae cyanobacterium]